MHIAPQNCEDGCCDEDCPEGSEPVVTCLRDETGFNYTVENATFAEIRVWCPAGVMGDPDTTEEVTLDEFGAASGTYAVDPETECTYCIFASNACGEAICCGDCDVPCCAIEIDPVTVPGQYTVNWSQYYFGCAGSAEVVSITVNGASQTVTAAEPDGGTKGSFDVDFSESPETWCIEVTNDCGVTSECCVTVPCCYRTTTMVLESTGFLAVYSRACTWSTAETGYGHLDVEEIVVINGLDGINGTILLAPVVLDGYDYSQIYPNLKGYCHTHDVPIPLGVFGSVEYYRTTTAVGGGYDSCGNAWAGYQTKKHNKWTGEFALLLSDYGQQIVLIPSDKQEIVFKGWSTARQCRYDPLNSCPSGYTEWSEDTDYCIHSVATPVGVHVSTLFSGSGYGGDCGPQPVCDTITDFCSVEVGAYERISAWTFPPRGYHIGCTAGLGTIIRTCDNGFVGTGGCGAVGYGSQRRVYSAQV